MRVLVLGAGALGVAAALHVARAGHEVRLLERGSVACGTTGLAGGLLSLGVVDHHDRLLTRLTMQGLAELEKHHPAQGADPGPVLHHPGSHLLVGPGGGAALVREMAKDLSELRAEHALWTPQQWVAEMQDRGFETHGAGLHSVLAMPGDAWAISTDATNLMARAAKAHGAKVTQSTQVSRLLRDGPRVTGVETAGGGKLAADAVVVAFGAWTRPFLDLHGLRLPARAYRTHAAILRTPVAARAPILHDDAGGYWFRPESPEAMMVGDGTRTEPTDPETFTNEPEGFFIERLATLFPRRFPQLAEARLQNAWRGVLTGVPDRHPLIGRHPDAPGLFLCTGGNGFGFMRSYALGACLAAALDGRGPPLGLPSTTLRWMDPARFWPDPPSEFPVREGFQIEVRPHA